MEIVLVGVIVIMIALGGLFFKNSSEKGVVQYKYRPKSIMTRREEETFRRLVRVFDRKFYIIPQVHLSSILSHEIKGQNWHGAFQHINRKSVDYVLLNKETLRVVCAVELDDKTHDSKKRQKRDVEVERILKGAGIPLVRTRGLSGYDEREIIALFAEVIHAA